MTRRRDVVDDRDPDVAIVRALHEAAGARLSGETLGGGLGITRAAVAARIRRLRRQGFDIHGRTHSGYLLRAEPDVPTAARVLPSLATTWLGRRWRFLPEVGSTNDVAGEAARAGAAAGLVVVAEAQTAGRGRLGRSWYAPAGETLTFSFVWRCDRSPAELAPLTLLSGAAVAGVVGDELGVAARVKWPNDVTVLGPDGRPRKVAGILTEMATEQERVSHVVVGIGLNVNVLAFPPDLAPRATSLRRALGHTLARVPLLIALLRRLETTLDEMAREGVGPGLRAFRRVADFGRRYRVHLGVRGGTVEGVAEDVAADGALLLRDDAGVAHRVTSGELGDVTA